MENLVEMHSCFGGIYKGKKILVTGHTGFKGSWLVKWLQLLGADVYGYALAPPSQPNHLSLLNLKIKSAEADVRDLKTLTSFISEVQPDIVFHLAAQALVRASYENPIETFSTNVMGTLNLFEACRKISSVKAIVNVTSDKCYENKEWIWGYRENDPMGGFDPYSASKGCAELLTASYRNSFFNPSEYKKTHHILLGSGRAGNVIGGGDWAVDRLIPDLMKAAAENSNVNIRNPKATRPWQHVLEPLSGYLNLGWMLLQEKKEFSEGWNFGPDTNSNLSVDEVVRLSKKNWQKINTVYGTNSSEHHEANLLMLDCSKANKLMKWKPVWGIDITVQLTIDWYKNYYDKNEVQTEQNISAYVDAAKKLKLTWAS
jgi:CDP-glucose 4,6-dehydratase